MVLLLFYTGLKLYIGMVLFTFKMLNLETARQIVFSIEDQQQCPAFVCHVRFHLSSAMVLCAT